METNLNPNLVEEKNNNTVKQRAKIIELKNIKIIKENHWIQKMILLKRKTWVRKAKEMNSLIYIFNRFENIDTAAIKQEDTMKQEQSQIKWSSRKK